MAIRVAVVGVGWRGHDWIREVKASRSFELVACVDTDQKALEKAALSFAVPQQHCFLDLETALDQADCQAVIVATSADCHGEACEIALSRGLAVLVEKPFTLSLPEAVKLVSLGEEKGAPLLVAQNYRYMRAFRTARRLILDGVLGSVGLVICQYYRVPHELPLSLQRLPNSVLWGMGVHHLDVLRYVLGKDVTRVTAESFTASRSQLTDGASLHVTLSLEGGTRAFYSATYESSGHEFFEKGQEFYARFTGELATLHLFHRWLVLCQTGKLPRLVRRGPREATEEQTLLRQLERALLHNEAAEVSGRDNLKTMAVLEACVRSATEQRSINPEELLHELQ